MTYLAFHFVFILPPIALLALAVRGRMGRVHPRAGLFLGLLPLIALVYTTPWDNYLVWRGVWGYGAERVIGTIGYVPVEEYLFFLLQPVLAGLGLYALLTRTAAGARALEPRRERRWVPLGADVRFRRATDRRRRRSGAHRRLLVRRTGAALYLAVALAGAALLTTEPGTYLGLILAWAAPVLAGQWYFAGGEIWARRRVAALAIALPSVYLWIADAVAIRLGIWTISERYTLGLSAFGLPLEEATFFLVTNVLVVQGLILFLFPPAAGGKGKKGKEKRDADGAPGSRRRSGFSLFTFPFSLFS